MLLVELLFGFSTIIARLIKSEPFSCSRHIALGSNISYLQLKLSPTTVEQTSVLKNIICWIWTTTLDDLQKRKPSVARVAGVPGRTMEKPLRSIYTVWKRVNEWKVISLRNSVQNYIQSGLAFCIDFAQCEQAFTMAVPL